MDIPVVELLRVSTEQQAGRLGLPAQRHANGQTCERYGLSICETVQIVMSGAEVAETPEMSRVLQMLESGRARGIVVAAYDRLFRPEKWSDMMVLQRIQDAAAAIYTPAGPIDLSTDLGHMQATLYNLFASMERKRIRERMAAGREEKRRRGQHVGFRCSLPYGLDWTEAAGWSYTPEIEIVRALFRRFLGGEHNYAALASEFGLARTTARFILTNVVYTGWRVYDEKRDSSPAGKYGSGRDRRKVKRAPDEVIRVRLRSADGEPIEPVVSPAEFASVQAIIERGRLASARANARTEGHFVYRGVLYCTCGEMCYSWAGGRTKKGVAKHFYHCKTRVARYGPSCGAAYMSAHLVEPVIDDVLRGRLTDERFLVRALAAFEAEQETGPTGPPVDVVAAQLERLEARRRRVLESFYDGVTSKEEMRRALASVDQERSRYNALLEPEAPRAGRMGTREVAGVLRVFRRWHRRTFDEKRQLLEMLAPRIYVKGYEAAGIWFDEAVFPGYNTVSHSPGAAGAPPAPAA